MGNKQLSMSKSASNVHFDPVEEEMKKEIDSKDETEQKAIDKAVEKFKEKSAFKKIAPFNKPVALVIVGAFFSAFVASRKGKIGLSLQREHCFHISAKSENCTTNAPKLVPNGSQKGGNFGKMDPKGPYTKKPTSNVPPNCNLGSHGVQNDENNAPGRPKGSQSYQN